MLARRLSSEGLTLHHILHSVKSALAQRHLADGKLSIAEIAWLLGFEDVHALTRAFIRSDTLEAALDALAAGVYIVDGQGRIIYMNQAAARQVKKGDALSIQNDRLSPVNLETKAAMRRSLAWVTTDETETPASGITLALRGSDGPGLVATILPLNRRERQNSPFRAKAAIFVQDPLAMPTLPGEAFAKLYGLTDAELRVLLAMAPGLGVREAAEILGISEATAKTHLQHIYAKTFTSKQTELMHLLISSAPPVRTS
jgi:DNA-binding CsgD family transcriptional regulator